MKHLNLKGIFPPIVTPFRQDEIATQDLASNVKQLQSTGISGLVVLGSNGENVFLSEKEKLQVVQTVIQSANDTMGIIVGTGCESTRETMHLTNLMAKEGAHAALVVTPFYYRGKMTQEAIIQHYEKVANQSRIPILLYNVPKFTGINLDATTVSILAKHPQIIGIKDSSGNINQLAQYINQTPDDFTVLVGTAGALFGALALGCQGGILALANIAPCECVRLYQNVLQGKWVEAQQIQLRMTPVNGAVTAQYGISGLKYAMSKRGYHGGSTRSPLLPITPQDRKKIDQILQKASL